MTKFDTPQKVFDEFQSFMGSGLSMNYHINGMPENIFIEELAQRDKSHGHEPDRDMYEKHIKVIVLQKKLLKTSDKRIFNYNKMQKRILEEKGLIEKEMYKTKHKIFLLAVLFILLILYITINFI